jgi:hypothetical protein
VSPRPARKKSCAVPPSAVDRLFHKPIATTATINTTKTIISISPIPTLVVKNYHDEIRRRLSAA